MTSLAHDTAEHLDAAALASLLQDVTQVLQVLAGQATASEDVVDFVRRLPGRLHAEAPVRAFTSDPYLVEGALAGSARAAAALLDSDARAGRRSARLGLEQVRQALHDMVEARPLGDDAPPAQVAAWLEGVLGVPQQQVAGLVGTNPRTWQRWMGGSQPDADSLARLRRVAALTAHLRHSLTGPGVARWFTRPHPLVKGGSGAPEDLLDDPDGYRQLLSLAAGLRGTQAS